MIVREIEKYLKEIYVIFNSRSSVNQMLLGVWMGVLFYGISWGNPFLSI